MKRMVLISMLSLGSPLYFLSAEKLNLPYNLAYGDDLIVKPNHITAPTLLIMKRQGYHGNFSFSSCDEPKGSKNTLSNFPGALILKENTMRIVSSNLLNAGKKRLDKYKFFLNKIFDDPVSAPP